MILPRRFAAGLFLWNLKQAERSLLLERRLSFGEHVPIAIKRYRDFSDFLYEKVKSKW